MKIRNLNGYRLIYVPSYPNAMTSDNWNGYIYEHIYFAAIMMGRSLMSDEVVHHLDGNRSNNNIANLLVLNKGQHHKLHMWLHKTLPTQFTAVGAGIGIYDNSPNPFCKVCGVTLQDTNMYTCSTECTSIYRESQSKVKNKPSKDELIELINNHPMEHIGGLYGVSSNAVRKWCIKYDIDYKNMLKSKNFIPTTKVCSQCGNDIQIKMQSDYKRKYCSLKCSGLANYNDNAKKCMGHIK